MGGISRLFAGSPAFAANDRAMQFVLVRAAGDCGPACPEWISAEGEITKDTPAAFAAILRALGKRRPPIIIHSRGGRLDSAIALGRVVRRHGFDVAVGRTSFVDCVPGHSGCPKLDVSKGRVGRLSEYLFSGCASACVAVLAAGKNRVLLGRSVVGVHQIRNIRPEQTVTRYRIYYRTVNGRRVEVRREVIGKQHVKRQERTLKANDKTYKQVAAYFSLMGVAPELADWFHRAPPQGMHWLSNSDLSATKIVTLGSAPTCFWRSRSLRQLFRLSPRWGRHQPSFRRVFWSRRRLRRQLHRLFLSRLVLARRNCWSGVTDRAPFGW